MATPLEPSFILTVVPRARTSSLKSKQQIPLTEEVLHEKLTHSEIYFAPEGLIVGRRTPGEDGESQEGWMIPVEKYAWVDRKDPFDFSAAAVGEEKVQEGAAEEVSMQVD